MDDEDKKLIALGRLVLSSMTAIRSAETSLPDWAKAEQHQTDIEMEGENWRIAVSRPADEPE